MTAGQTQTRGAHLVARWKREGRYNRPRRYTGGPHRERLDAIGPGPWRATKVLRVTATTCRLCFGRRGVGLVELPHRVMRWAPFIGPRELGKAGPWAAAAEERTARAVRACELCSDAHRRGLVFPAAIMRRDIPGILAGLRASAVARRGR